MTRHKLDKIFLVFLLIWLSRAWIYLGDAESQEEINAPFVFFFQIFCQLLCLYVLLFKLKPKDIFGFLAADKLLTCFLIFAILSIPFSTVPVNSFGMGRAVVLLVAGACYLRKRLSPKEIARTVVDVAGFILLASIFVSLFFSFGSAGGPHVGNWRGLFSHKNNLGEISAFSLIISFAYLISYGRLGIRLFVYLFAAVVCLVMSGSATSAAASGVVIGSSFIVYFVSRLPIARSSRGIISLAFFLALGYGAYYALDQAVELFGRDITFTGRTAIWAQYLEFAAERPWMGWGWTASTNNDEILSSVRDFVNLPFLRTTHSIYVQMAVDFGFLMALLYLLWIATATFSAFYLSSKFRSPEFFIRACVAAGMMMIGGFESIVGIMPCLWFGFLLFTAKNPVSTGHAVQRDARGLSANKAILRF